MTWAADDYKEHGTGHLDGWDLVGWRLAFYEETKCPKKKELEQLIYLAQIQVSDIVAHLPPFDECPLDCDDCQLERVLLEEIPISGSQYNIQYVQWESPKLRANVPKYIFKVFNR